MSTKDHIRAELAKDLMAADDDYADMLRGRVVNEDQGRDASIVYMRLQLNAVTRAVKNLLDAT